MRTKEELMDSLEVPDQMPHINDCLILEVLIDIRDQLKKIADCTSKGTAEAI